MSRARGCLQSKFCAGDGSGTSSSRRGSSNSSNSSNSSTGLASLYSIHEIIDSARAVAEAYKEVFASGKEQASKHKAFVASLLRLLLGKMQIAGIRGPCSSQCPCADYASTMRQLVNACSKAVREEGVDCDERSIVQDCIYRGLPAVAAQLLDPTAGHRLEAVHDALHAFREHVVLPIINSAHLADTTAAAASRQWALQVALAASKPGGLTEHLGKQLCALCDQWRSARAANTGRGAVQQGLEPAPTAQPDAPVTHHVLAQLLLVFQWIAALCRIWPSSIPDAAPLHSLLRGSLAAAAELMEEFPHMQVDARALSTAASSGVCSVDVTPAAATTSPAAELFTPVTAAMLEVAAIVLEPLGLLLHKQQEAKRHGTQPPSQSAAARDLCGQLQGESTALLQAMLAVCLDQLVVHAERKLGASDVSKQCLQQQQVLKQSALSSSAASCDAAGSSSMINNSGGEYSNSASRSIAESAGGCLLQHADTLQVKQPAARNRAAVIAWRGVCEKQWAAGSLPLTLQAAAVVLASTQPAAACSADSSAGSAGYTAPAAWALQDRGPLGGNFGVLGQGASSAGVGHAGGPAPTSSSGSCTAAVGFGQTPTSTSTSYASTSHCSSAGLVQGLPPAVGSEPILSIASCTLKATALSAVCQRAASMEGDNARADTSSHWGVACTLLATAAAAVDLQGTAALPLVSAAAHAVTSLVLSSDRAPAQQHAAPASAEQRPHVAAAAATGSHVSGSDTQKHTAAKSTQAASVAVPAAVSDRWLCLSLAADLTKAVLQLQEGQQAQQLGPDSVATWHCGFTLRLLVDCLSIMGHACMIQACPTELATQLQTVAYTLQLVEASVRQFAAARKATPGRTHNQCCLAGFAIVRSALAIITWTGDIVLGSLQGQQLLQSCTSLLLTCSSLQQGGGVTSGGTSSSNLAICVMLLQLLQRSEALAAVGGSSFGMSQSLAAGLSVTGRTLVGLGTTLSRRDCVPDSLLQKTVQDLADCVQSINQTLQQDVHLGIATAKAAAEGVGISTIVSDRVSSSFSSHSYVSTSSLGANNADAVQGRDQQLQRAPADWLLAGMDAAQVACATLLSSIHGAQAPLMAGMEKGMILTGGDMIALLATWDQIFGPCVTAGEALCAAAPCSACCSNPRCTNLSGVSAGFALVRGKGCVCGGCLGLQAGGSAAAPSQGPLVAARYCSRACQAAHRQQHKGLCDKLARAAATAAHDGDVGHADHTEAK